jgi:glycosyltransferase involved in cell wall biosynthesis
MMSSDVAVVILTYNEEENIAQALRSVCGWAHEVFVLDSFSRDRTLEIARQFPCVIEQHAFEDYGKQRNHALDALPISCEWVLFLDADEWLPPDLKDEIAATLARHPAENGFYIKRRFIWMGRWIRRGYYPVFLLRLFRHRRGRCEDRAVNEHIVVDGTTGVLRNDLMHEDRKSIERWIGRHNDFALREARELLNQDRHAHVEARLFGPQEQRKRWIRLRLWNRLPPLTRPFVYFTYRYLLRGGFLDGKEALVYHLMQGLWFPLLIDMRFLELRQREREPAR